MRRYVPCLKNSIPFPATVSKNYLMYTPGGSQGSWGSRVTGVQVWLLKSYLLTLLNLNLFFHSSLFFPFLFSVLLLFPSALPLLFLSSHLLSSPLFFLPIFSSSPLPLPPPPPLYFTVTLYRNEPLQMMMKRWAKLDKVHACTCTCVCIVHQYWSHSQTFGTVHAHGSC